MKKITYEDLRDVFWKHEEKKPDTPMTGYIVFTEDSFDETCSLESRTYKVLSSCKAFNPYSAGYSIFGSALDGSIKCVRLDEYMAIERSDAAGWEVEYCYLEDDAVLPKGMTPVRRTQKQQWRVGFKTDGKWTNSRFTDEDEMIEEIQRCMYSCEQILISKI